MPDFGQKWVKYLVNRENKDEAKIQSKKRNIKISRRFSKEGGIGVEFQSLNQVRSIPHLEIVRCSHRGKNNQAHEK